MDEYPDKTYDIDVVETKHPVTGQIQRSGRWSVTDPEPPSNHSTDNERN
jgi:hypothetical protein